MSNPPNPRPCWKNKWIYITISALIVFLGVLSILYLPDILLLLWKTWGEKEHIITEPCPVNILQNSSSIIAYLTAIFSFFAFIGILLTIYCQRQDAKKQQSFSDKQLFDADSRHMLTLIISIREKIKITTEEEYIVPLSDYNIYLAKCYLLLPSDTLQDKAKNAQNPGLPLKTDTALSTLTANQARIHPYIVMFFATINNIIASNLSDEEKRNKIMITSNIIVKDELCLVMFYGLLIGDKIMISSIDYIDKHKMIEEPYGANISREYVNNLVKLMKDMCPENRRQLIQQFIGIEDELDEVPY